MPNLKQKMHVYFSLDLKTTTISSKNSSFLLFTCSWQKRFLPVYFQRRPFWCVLKHDIFGAFMSSSIRLVMVSLNRKPRDVRS